MSPDQFLSQLRRQDPAPAYLFLGAEPFRRDMCRQALIEKVLGTEEREQALAQFDLRETPLSAIVDEARSLSLFAPRRLIWVANAEAALPRGRTAEAEEGEPAGTGPLGALTDYMKHPAPDVVVVLEASRY